jgi:DNA-binding MarR family transcriptional regulator
MIESIPLDVKRFRASVSVVGDEVDRLVAAWRRELPELDPSPVEVRSRVGRLARHLDRARAGVLARHGLEAWMFDVLAALRRAGAPFERTPGQLLAETLVSSGAMTNRLDGLEAVGLVRRRPCPTDARRVLVRLTPAGRRRVDAAVADLLEQEEAILAALPRRDRDRLAGSLRSLLAPFDG